MIKNNLRNLSYIWFSSVTSVATAFLSQSILARVLSVTDFGYFSSYMGLINLLVPTAGLGLTSYWLKSYGKNKAISKELIAASLSIVLISYVITCFLVILTSTYHAFDNILFFGVLSLIIISRLISDMFSTILQVKGRFFKFAIAQSALPVIRLVLLLLVIYVLRLESLNAIAVIWSISSVILLLIFYKTLRDEFPNPLYIIQRLTVSFSDGYTKSVLSKSFIFGLTGLLYLGWSQGHIVFAKFYFGDYGAGMYSSVIIIGMAISMFPNVVFSKLLAPKYHEFIYSNPFQLKKLFWLANLALFTLGIIAMVIVYSISEFIVGIAFGDKYLEAASILKIISMTFPMRFCGFNSGLILTTRNFQPVKFRLLIIAVVLNIILAVLLSNLHGIEGLAFSIVVTEFLLVLGYTIIANIRLNQLCTPTKSMH